MYRDVYDNHYLRIISRNCNLVHKSHKITNYINAIC